jgi:hypothetical protein
VWRAGTILSSTFGYWPEVRMECSARMFVCARCREQVLICSDCDRGQRYCTRLCSNLARRAARREAARRYQFSRRGRMAHAARSQRWRIRHHRPNPGVPLTSDANIVTHQGSQGTPADVPLVAWTSNPVTNPTCEPDPRPRTVVERSAAPARCRRCGALLAPWVRQGFLLRPSGGYRTLRHDDSP